HLTLPGLTQDVGTAVHLLALSSPIFRSCRLEQHGLKWIHPIAPFAHPLDDGSAVLIHRSVDGTARELGRDESVWKRAFGPMAERWDDLVPDILGPLRWPQQPFLFARFGVRAPWPATVTAGG